ncbi:OLC1v1012846C1 [Oldenlandia corymbosa var. corymbosa]|uniref:OLC1v1012846C1 n=1 Tax=Oldenlandia corymbosa var. corymbosa TaxID=529605 RepID=A0AAV1E0B2_OLDCO|nr:OLC1v1012846C1 [Oldenlandia corymbosa var. corymbosa]
MIMSREVIVAFLLLVSVMTTTNKVVKLANGQTICNMSGQELMSCRPAVTPPNPSNPSSVCCTALKHADMSCLCSFKNSTFLPTIGIDWNLAVQLPEKCKLPPRDRRFMNIGNKIKQLSLVIVKQREINSYSNSVKTLRLSALEWESGGKATRENVRIYYETLGYSIQPVVATWSLMTRSKRKSNEAPKVSANEPGTSDGAQQTEVESARGMDTALPEKVWLKQQFAIGVNEVTRLLERMPPVSSGTGSSHEVGKYSNEIPSGQLQAILLASDCNPRWLSKHLRSLANSRNVPILYVKDNKRGSLRLGEVVKLKTAIAIGIKGRGNAINQLVQKVLGNEIPVAVDCKIV